MLASSVPSVVGKTKRRLDQAARGLRQRCVVPDSSANVPCGPATTGNREAANVRREQTITTWAADTVMTDDDIRKLVEQKSEGPNLDYKEGFVWAKDNRDKKYELIRD